jgi:hypothetical protein
MGVFIQRGVVLLLAPLHALPKRRYYLPWSWCIVEMAA